MLIIVLTLIASFKKKNLQSLSWVSLLKNHLSSLSPESPRTIPASISPSLEPEIARVYKVSMKLYSFPAFAHSRWRKHPSLGVTRPRLLAETHF